jgi:hypothetical protein
MRVFGWRILRWLTVAVFGSLLFLAYNRWREGDPFYVPGIGTVYRFPCSSYRYTPAVQAGFIQAFGVIDGAALAAGANDKERVTALVDVVFDRLLPATRCGNRLRNRVADAEVRFRQGLRPSISEREWSEAANEALGTAGAPEWARVSVAELHLLREELRPELPRFIGTVRSGYQLSDRLSPVEAAFVAMQLGSGLIHDPDEFRDGPDGWVEHVRAIQANPAPPQPPKAVLRVSVQTGPNLERELNDRESPTSRSVHRFLDHLGFPP